jgi:hypothetical protein
MPVHALGPDREVLADGLDVERVGVLVQRVRRQAARRGVVAELGEVAVVGDGSGLPRGEQVGQTGDLGQAAGSERN